MQTVQPLRRLAVIAEILSRCSGRPHSIQNNVCSPSRNLCPIWQVSTSVIGPGHQVTGVGFAYQTSRSISAVRIPMRREMLASRAKLVRRSRFAPAAKPPVSSFRAAPGRSVSITHNAQAAARKEPLGQSSSARLARPAQAVFNRACHCLPPPRMRCLTTRSTGPIAACGQRPAISFWAFSHIPQRSG